MGRFIECDKCGADMQLKSGRFGKYFGCTNADCKNTRKLLRSGEPAPPKADPIPMPELKCAKVDDYYLLRDGASGIFFSPPASFRNTARPGHRWFRSSFPTVMSLIPNSDILLMHPNKIPTATRQW